MNRYTREQSLNMLQSECCVAGPMQILKMNFGRNTAPAVYVLVMLLS